MRILAVDPGERYLGVAVCDPTGTVARPLTTIDHVSRVADAERIGALAQEQGAELVIIGCALDANGRPGAQARHAQRLAEAVQHAASLPVALHDESFSSLAAGQAMRASGKNRRARREQIHAVSAAAILQSYLDAHPRETPPD
jgi:putative Holliday junction resolvase